MRAIASPQSYERLSYAFTPEMQDRFLTNVSTGVFDTEDDRVARAKTLMDAFFSGFGTSEST